MRIRAASFVNVPKYVVPAQAGTQVFMRRREGVRWWLRYVLRFQPSLERRSWVRGRD